MPSLNLTIEDNSPVLAYSKNWRAGTSNDDSLADSYSQSSFMISDKNGDSVSFAFNGTGIQIFGAKRDNHGPYHATLDGPGGLSLDENGDGGNTSRFGVSLTPSLPASFPQGEHTLTLTNTGVAQFLDVDFLSWQTSIGLPNEQLLVGTFQDTDPSFTYVPAEAWSTNPKNVGLFMGGSGHTTSTPGAFLQFTFQERDTVALYGPVDPNGTDYAAQIDGGVITNYTTIRKYYRPQLMMYQASNLGPGTHNLKLFCGSGNSGRGNLAIDYVTIFTTPSLLEPTHTGSDSSNSRSLRSRLNSASIAGITIGGIIATFVIAALVYYYFFYRPKRQLNKHGKKSSLGIPSLSGKATTRIRPISLESSESFAILHPSSRKLPMSEESDRLYIRPNVDQWSTSVMPGHPSSMGDITSNFESDLSEERRPQGTSEMTAPTASSTAKFTGYRHIRIPAGSRNTPKKSSVAATSQLLEAPVT